MGNMRRWPVVLARHLPNTLSDTTAFMQRPSRLCAERSCDALRAPASCPSMNSLLAGAPMNGARQRCTKCAVNPAVFGFRARPCLQIDDLEDRGDDRLQREAGGWGSLALQPVALLQEDRERRTAVLDPLDRAGSDCVGLYERHMGEGGCVVDALGGSAKGLPQALRPVLAREERPCGSSPSDTGSRARGSR